METSARENEVSLLHQHEQEVKLRHFVKIMSVVVGWRG